MSTTIYSTTDNRGERVSLHHHTEYRGHDGGGLYSYGFVNEHGEQRYSVLMRREDAESAIARLVGGDRAGAA